MNVVVDTPIWSAAYRRSSSSEIADELRDLIADGRCILLGVVRQEVLQGIPSKAQFNAVRADLDEFLDAEVWSSDHVRAATLYNRCRGRGVQPTTIDMLICSVAERMKAAIFTLDRDFVGYSRVLGVKLFGPSFH